MSSRPKIALWFRYGAADHVELFPAIVEIVRRLASQAEVHYFSLRGLKPIPEIIEGSVVFHILPFSINRASSMDKFLKTGLWLICLPWLALQCRRLGINLVYIEETIPLSAMIARIFFGNKVAITIADFFVNIYMMSHPIWRPLGRLINAVDLASWRRLPLIFTRVQYTKTYLVRKGFEPDRIVPVYDACDFSIYRPGDRKAARAAFDYHDDHVVLVNHGYMHPNKGNDKIIIWVASLRDSLPALRFMLVGSGPDMARLQQIVRDLHAEDVVRFTGWLKSPEMVTTALNAGDIGLAMREGQESDNFHVTSALVHNMACGLPVLAARLQGMVEIVREGETGLLFDPNSREEFAAQLTTLAQSRDLRARCGAAGYRVARDLFDVRAVAEKTAVPLLALMKQP
ncbi:MAG: glycosyltransferase [Kiritimatiellia bacterium]|jgi:glycosyltransferase involved in cell wall biosynthesis